MFLDELIERRGERVRYTVGLVIVTRRTWRERHSHVTHSLAVRFKRRLELIAALLEQVEGFALITYADVPVALVPAGETDGTDDIPAMARADNLWSQAVLSTVAAGLGFLRARGVTGVALDLFYDPKSLTAAHRSAYEHVLRETLTNITREDPHTSEVSAEPPLTFVRIEPVPKSRESPEEYRIGIFLADQLCRQARALISFSGAFR